MNPRIRELAEQAMELVDPYALEGEFGPRRLNEAKFAELIVRECADICYNREYTDGTRYGDEIIEHFGVE